MSCRCFVSDWMGRREPRSQAEASLGEVSHRFLSRFGAYLRMPGFGALNSLFQALGPFNGMGMSREVFLRALGMRERRCGMRCQSVTMPLLAVFDRFMGMLQCLRDRGIGFYPCERR